MSSLLDSTAIAALEGEVIYPRFLAYLDFVGDPVRATTWPVPLTMSGTGDADLDGFTFDALRPDLVSISPVSYGERGMDTVTAILSGLATHPDDADRYALLIDPTNWQGRRAVLWQGIADANYQQQGNFWSYCDGRMVDVKIRGDRDGQTIEVTFESYLAALSPASLRTLLDQSYFDSADKSAAATIGSANGAVKARGGLPVLGANGGGGGGRRPFNVDKR